ncbi:MAG: hypothetical protein IJD70_08450 [Clostridia bacterium]|nr:hypothetical protein [Clostridia bacterium]
MKSVKNFTCAIAVMLCIFVCIYVLTLYLKFQPQEPEMLEDGTMEELPGKLEQFLDANVNTEEHINLVFLLAISAAAGLLLEKVPAFGMLTSACALGYALTMLRFEALPKFPRTVVVLCIAHAAGAIFYAATSERGKKNSLLGLNSAASGGLLCNIAALGITAYICPILANFHAASEKLELLKEEGLVISTKLASIPDVVDMLWRVFENHGIAKTRSLLNELSKQYDAKGIAADIHMTYVGEEYSVYLKLGIIIFGIVILALAFRRRAWVGAALSAIPPIYIFGNIMFDKISTLTLTLLTLTLFGAIGAFAAYQREGEPALVDERGEEIEIEEEDDPTPDELPKTDGEDDAEGDSITDWECEKLDYFYERPKPEPITPEELSQEERDEYLEIEENENGDQKDDNEQL